MKNKNYLLSLLLAFLPFMTWAHDFAAPNADGKMIYYNITSEAEAEPYTVEVTYQGEEYYEFENRYTGTVIIPETVTYEEKTYEVTGIGDEAFLYCQKVTEVRIGDKVTTIGRYAFESLENLHSIIFGNKVTSIGEYAFYKCTSLNSITLPASLTTISDQAFSECNYLVEIYNLSSLSLTPGGYGNGGVTGYAKVIHTDLDTPSILVNKDNYIFTVFEGATELIHYQGTETALSLPESIEYNRQTITSYTIGEQAFYQNDNITSVIIPDAVTTIENSAFRECESLSSVTLGKNIIKIGEQAFHEAALKNVTIPASVKEIQSRAFECNTLENIEVDPENASYLSLDGVLYTKDKTTLLQFPAQKNGIEIPESVTSIGEYAFYSCYKLTSIIIPDAVTTIGNRGFGDCSNLTSITLGSGLTTIEDNAFSGCETLVEIYNLSELELTKGSYENGSVARYAKVIHTSIEDKSILANIDGYTFVVLEDKAELLSYTGTDTNLKLPNTFEYDGQTVSSYTIGKTFRINKGVISLVIPDAVTEIPEGQFEEYFNLFSVTIGKNVTQIGEYAFHDCERLFEVYNLSQLDIQLGSTDNGNIARYAKVLHTSHDEPSIIAREGDYIFTVIDGQADLVRYIGSQRELNLPESFNYLGETIQHYAISDNNEEDFASLIYDELPITSVFIPDAVTKVGMKAFIYMKDLQTITLGKNVTELGMGAFGACPSVTSITSYAVTPPAAGEMAFYEIPTDIPVYVPIQSIEAYQAASEWSGFSNFKGIGPFNTAITVNDEQMGSVALTASHNPDENGRYFYGTTLTLEAQANEGYHFVRWNDNETNPSRTLSVQSDLTLQAIFEKDAKPEPVPVYYTVTLPAVEGATTDPAAGNHEVESWDNFRFYLTLDKEYDLSVPIVTTDRGETIEPRTSDGAYIIRYVRSPITIHIDGIVKNPDPVGNETIETNRSKVWTSEGNLHIEAATAGAVAIYTFEGKLLARRQALAGEELKIGIPSGVYIILIGQERFKVRM